MDSQNLVVEAATLVVVVTKFAVDWIIDSRRHRWEIEKEERARASSTAAAKDRQRIEEALNINTEMTGMLAKTVEPQAPEHIKERFRQLLERYNQSERDAREKEEEARSPTDHPTSGGGTVQADD